MSLSIDGTSLIFDGTVTITNFSSPGNGIATLTLTPSGGVGSLPALVAGDPGLPPTLTVGTVTTLTAGSSATASLTQTAAGGAGVASAYQLNLGLPAGAAGTNGTNGTLAGSSDLTGTAAVGNIITVSSISPTAFKYTTFPYGFVANPSTITSVTNTTATTKQLAALSIPVQPFAWVPVCLATATVVGTANTVINLQATLTAGTRSGDVIGQAFGYAGQATQTLSMNSGFGGLITSTTTSGFGVVAANTAATIFFNALQTAGTVDPWSLASSTATFTVIGIPV